MNLLAASVQFWAEPEIVDYISKKDFKPRPKVDSAIIKFNIKTSDVLRTSDVQKLKYYQLIKILFKQPRKTILNNLINLKTSDFSKIDVNIRKSDILKSLNKVGINPQDRPQNLTIEQIKKLSTLF
jgi:16S rRNA (adenine1518-N6/adenine1519-N6)-dimethyltransferase